MEWVQISGHAKQENKFHIENDWRSEVVWAEDCWNDDDDGPNKLEDLEEKIRFSSSEVGEYVFEFALGECHLRTFWYWIKNYTVHQLFYNF